eukprot:3454030-Pyramimonas_sp.AAC.1
MAPLCLSTLRRAQQHLIREGLHEDGTRGHPRALLEAERHEGGDPRDHCEVPERPLPVAPALALLPGRGQLP